jgi:His-Xaa-Ser system radical SAM maturase HxsC
MIPLRLRAAADGIQGPFVARLNAIGMHGDTEHDAALLGRTGTELEFETGRIRFLIRDASAEDVDGDVVLVVPQRQVAHRLVRAGSEHNTFLITEQCDQQCVMCSQPPKPHHVDLFDHFEIAAALAPAQAVIGLSGGEPTLHKERLFRFLNRVTAARPDLGFHILTNGQHFDASDFDALASLPHDQITWGIPLYSPDPARHDAIVGKGGAYDRLLRTFPVLARAGASIELRTVVLKSNASDLPRLARLISANLPFTVRWAIMQLENTGYARKNWKEQFCDSSVEFAAIAAAIDIARALGLSPVLYNFPLCTIPAPYRHLAPSTISDWKRKYLSGCNGCAAKSDCGGFFEWYPESSGFAHLGLQ